MQAEALIATNGQMGQVISKIILINIQGFQSHRLNYINPSEFFEKQTTLADFKQGNIYYHNQLYAINMGDTCAHHCCAFPCLNFHLSYRRPYCSYDLPLRLGAELQAVAYMKGKSRAFHHLPCIIKSSVRTSLLHFYFLCIIISIHIIIANFVMKS